MKNDNIFSAIKLRLGFDTKNETETPMLRSKVKLKRSPLRIIWNFVSSFSVAFGLIFSYIYFRELLTLDPAIYTSLGLSFFIGISFSLSRRFRCISTLSLPELTSRQGRLVLLSIVTSLLVSGPLCNIIVNGRQASDNLACVSDLINDAQYRPEVIPDGDTDGEEPLWDWPMIGMSRLENGRDFQFNLTLEGSIKPTKNVTEIRQAVKDGTQPVLNIVNITLEVVKYILILPIFLIPYKSWSYLRRFRKDGEKIARAIEVQNRASDLQLNLVTFFVHLCFSGALVGFNFLFYHIQLITFEALSGLSFDVERSISVDGSQNSGSGDEREMYTMAEAEDGGNNKKDMGATCFEPPSRPSIGTLYTISGIYIFVFVCIFVGVFAAKLKARIVFYFYPGLKEEANERERKLVEVVAENGDKR